MSEDFWVDGETDDVPSRWQVVDGSGEMSYVIAYCQDREDAERIVRVLQADWDTAGEHARDEADRLRAEQEREKEDLHTRTSGCMALAVALMMILVVVVGVILLLLA